MKWFGFAIASAAVTGIIGAAGAITNYIHENVPWFVWANGLKYAIHYLQGKDAWDEIYEKIGVGKRRV